MVLFICNLRGSYEHSELRTVSVTSEFLFLNPYYTIQDEWPQVILIVVLTSYFV